MAEWEQGKNPLLNQLVIYNISKYLTLKELKVCRGLNHLWKKTTNKIFLKHCPRIFLLSPNKKDDVRRSKKTMTIAQFMEIYSNPEHPHPHAQLLQQYRNFELEFLAEEYVSIFYNFMTEVGPQMTSLTLFNVQVLRKSQDLVDIISSKYTPNLEKLNIFELREIGNCQQSYSEKFRIEGKENKHLRRLSLDMTETDNSKIPWLDVLSRYPKLKVLSLNRFLTNVLEEIASALVTIRKANEAKLKLTELDISNTYSISETKAERKARWQRIGDLLKTANLPLEKISLDHSASQISLALIQHYSENLKRLTFKGDTIPQPFPLMKALEKIVIIIAAHDWTFLTKVPNLKSMYFYHKKHNNQFCYPESSLDPLLSLIELSCGGRGNCRYSEIEKLPLWMPNVQKLEMHLNSTTFPLICQHYPNLKELTVLGQDLDDYGIVGESYGALDEGCSAHILNLKALETFTMTGLEYIHAGLTEQSVFYGFSLMPKLSKLTLIVKSELSAAAMLTLNRIKRVQIKVAST